MQATTVIKHVEGGAELPEMEANQLVYIDSGVYLEVTAGQWKGDVVATVGNNKYVNLAKPGSPLHFNATLTTRLRRLRSSEAIFLVIQ